MFCWLTEFQKLSILGLFATELEEVDTAKWDTREEEANLEMNVLFVSFFEKLNLYFLVAATPGFANQRQFTNGYGYRVYNLYYFLFCDWNSSWTLLYAPIDENERKEIDEIIKVSKSLKRAKFKFYSEMQCVFDSQIKRLRLFNYLRNQVNHRNSIFIFNFLPRRPKFDKIGQRFKLKTKRYEVSQPRSSKCDAKRD